MAIDVSVIDHIMYQINQFQAFRSNALNRGISYVTCKLIIMRYIYLLVLAMPLCTCTGDIDSDGELAT
jgi:hypothetical protein